MKIELNKRSLTKSASIVDGIDIKSIRTKKKLRQELRKGEYIVIENGVKSGLYSSFEIEGTIDSFSRVRMAGRTTSGTDPIIEAKDIDVAAGDCIIMPISSVVRHKGDKDQNECMTTITRYIRSSSGHFGESNQRDDSDPHVINDNCNTLYTAELGVAHYKTLSISSGSHWFISISAGTDTSECGFISGANCLTEHDIHCKVYMKHDLFNQINTHPDLAVTEL